MQTPPVKASVSHETVRTQTPAANGVPRTPTICWNNWERVGSDDPTASGLILHQHDSRTQVNRYPDQLILDYPGNSQWRRGSGQGVGVGHGAPPPSQAVPPTPCEHLDVFRKPEALQTPSFSFVWGSHYAGMIGHIIGRW